MVTKVYYSPHLFEINTLCYNKTNIYHIELARSHNKVHGWYVQKSDFDTYIYNKTKGYFKKS